MEQQLLQQYGLYLEEYFINKYTGLIIIQIR